MCFLCTKYLHVRVGEIRHSALSEIPKVSLQCAVLPTLGVAKSISAILLCAM